MSEKTTKETIDFDESKDDSKSQKPIISQEDIMKMLDTIYGKCLNGVPKVSKPVDVFAEEYLSKYETKELACKKMLNNQIIKCTTSGFVTGFGGVVTMPVTLPANITNVLYVQMRMIACTAYMAGLKLDDDSTQTFVYACLAGVAVNGIAESIVLAMVSSHLVSIIFVLLDKSLSVVLTIHSADRSAEKLLRIIVEGHIALTVCPFEKAELVEIAVTQRKIKLYCHKINPFIVDVPPEHFVFDVLCFPYIYYFTTYASSFQ